MWGGCTCPVCGAGVDKWGREVAPAVTRAVFRPQSEIRKALKKKIIIITAIVNFCLTILSYWLGFGSDRWVPSSWKEAMVQIGLAILVSSFWTVVFVLIFGYAADYFLFNEKPGTVRRHKSDEAKSG
jgi:hypothetical protein